MKLTKKAHKQRHQELHRYLDELVADYILHTKGLPSQKTNAKTIVNKPTINKTQAPMDAKALNLSGISPPPVSSNAILNGIQSFVNMAVADNKVLKSGLLNRCSFYL